MNFKKRHCVSSIISIMSVLCIVVSGAWAQNIKEEVPTEKTKIKSSGWQVQCINVDVSLKCSVNMTITSIHNKQRLLQFSIQKLSNDSSSNLLIQLPLGLYLPKGINLQIDDNKSRNFEVTTCNQAGCFVKKRIKNSQIDEMKKGNKMIISMEAENHQKINIEVTLVGFAQAANKLN